MTLGARITDAVGHLCGRGNARTAVRLIRTRSPERLRWRAAVATLTRGTAGLEGRDRMIVEEPLRELVLDLGDTFLQREVVLDARMNRVDLDRGEILPRWSMGELRRLCYLAQTEVELIERYVRLPPNFDTTIDTAAVVLVGRSFARLHRERAQRLLLQLPDEDGPEQRMRYHDFIQERALEDGEKSKRWAALAKTLISYTT